MARGREPSDAAGFAPVPSAAAGSEAATPTGAAVPAVPDERAGSPQATQTSQAASEEGASPKPGAPLQSPAGKLTIAQARKYMLDLVNRDRASMGLGPVALEDGAAQRAGQAHAEDMAKNGYLGHWGSDGSVPEQRYTEAGGSDMVMENASCFTDEHARKLDHAPLIDPKNIEEAEDMFFHETPPHDGHRKNILKPWHKTVGIGIAQRGGEEKENSKVTGDSWNAHASTFALTWAWTCSGSGS